LILFVQGLAMLQLLRYGVWAFFRLLLAARYRIRVHGLKELRGLKGPTVILPNHPGYVDPPLVLTALWPTLHPRPMLYEGNFRTPMLHTLMMLLNAVEVPDLDSASVRARQQAEGAVAKVVEGLRNGETHILWPSGHVQRDGTERLGAARALTDILTAVPEANVILVRTRGVWGSMYSYAYTGEAPSVVGGILKGLGLLLANVFVFLPRRTVDLTVERLDRSKLPDLQREKINPWFEAWYNAGGPEKPKFVPHHFLFGPRTYEFPRPKGM
jgi:long-chain-fatty-acid--[acyl-carrier-protein] ligase